MNQDHIIDINLQNFANEVIQRSHAVPVLIDFWAEWCGPCQSLTPILEKLAADYEGRFILAKCNTDQNQDLAGQFGIRGIPACKLFKDGELVDEFQGVQSEANIRGFLDTHCEADEIDPILMAKQLLSQGDFDAAEALLNRLLLSEPSAIDAKLLLARIKIQKNDFAGAEASLLGVTEAEPELKALRQMISYARTAAEFGSLDECAARSQRKPDDLEALYQWGVVLSLNDRVEEAMQKYLLIIAKNKNYGEGKVRQAMLTLFEVLGAEHPLTQEYRRKFANLVL